MTGRMARVIVAACLAAAGFGSASQTQAPAQTQPQPQTSDANVAPAPWRFTPAQLDQMTAPIALYPDDLLGQVLMAAGYPLEVVEADRWLSDPANAGLGGQDLFAAVDQQDWEPSVKALTPFAPVLRLMAGNLDWTESLGEAFIADPDAVMDSVQRLRRKAQAHGKLRTTPEQIVSIEDGLIVIEPAVDQSVYVPDYDPDAAYGDWDDADFPPDYFPDYLDDCVVANLGFCWLGLPIVAPLWGWDHWDWRRHHIDIDRGRFTRLNNGRPPAGPGTTWTHDPAHRAGVPYVVPATRGRFGSGAASPETERSARGYPQAGPTPRPSAPRPQVQPAPRPPPTIESWGQGDQVRAQAARGQASRASPPPPPPPPPRAPSYAPMRSAPSGGAGGRPSGGGRGPR